MAADAGGVPTTVRLSQPNGVDLVAADEAVLPQAVGLHADHRARSLGIEADRGENDQAPTRKPREDSAAEMIGHGCIWRQKAVLLIVVFALLGLYWFLSCATYGDGYSKQAESFL